MPPITIFSFQKLNLVIHYEQLAVLQRAFGSAASLYSEAYTDYKYKEP